MPKETDLKPRPRYVWPWFVLGAFLLGVALAVLWLSREVKRLRQYKTFPPASAAPATNASSPAKTN
jgi:hypothetical protein